MRPGGGDKPLRTTAVAQSLDELPAPLSTHKSLKHGRAMFYWLSATSRAGSSSRLLWVCFSAATPNANCRGEWVKRTSRRSGYCRSRPAASMYGGKHAISVRKQPVSEVYHSPALTCKMAVHSCFWPCSNRKAPADVHPPESIESEMLRASRVTVPVFSTTTVKGMLSPASGRPFPFSSFQDPVVSRRAIAMEKSGE